MSSTSSSVIHPEREVAISNRLAISTFSLVMWLLGQSSAYQRCGDIKEDYGAGDRI